LLYGTGLPFGTGKTTIITGCLLTIACCTEQACRMEQAKL